MLRLPATLALLLTLAPACAAEARIVRLKEARNPWQRVEFEVYVDLATARP